MKPVLPRSAFCAVLAVSVSPLFAQLRVTAVTPRGHALAAPTATLLTMSFDQPLNPATVTPASFQVFARWSGPLPGTLSLANGNRDLVFTPSRALFPGEYVLAMASAAIAAQAGPNLTGGHSWTFWAAPVPGTGQLQYRKTLDVRRPSEGRVASYGSSCGDLDHDGAIDFSVPNELADDVRVLRNDGCATFAAPAAFGLPSGSVPSPNEQGDFDRDGHIDLAIANTSGNTISVLLGTGLGGYRPARTYPAGGNPRGIAVLDAEGDGDLDIATSNRATSNVALFRNNGDGTFAAATFFDGGGTGECGLVAADANNDGKLDLLVGHITGQTCAVLLNDGTGAFTAQPAVAAGGGPWMVTAGDVNGDGNCDLVSANNNNGTVAVLLGNGQGRLGPASTVPVGAAPVSIDLADLDGDGDLDLASASYATGSYSFYRNGGTGTFGGRSDIVIGAAGSCAILVDWDRDGDVDFVGVDEVDDKLYLYAQVGPDPAGAQAASCGAALRIDEQGDRGGYGTQPTHRARAGGRFFVGVSGAPNAPFLLVGGGKRAPGMVLPFGLLNVDTTGLVPLASASLDGAGELRLVVPVPAATPIGVGVAFQAAVLDPTRGVVLTNPEEVAASN